MPAIPFEFRQISDVGTANPIVARVSYQWFELIKFFNLPEATSQGVLAIMHDQVQPRLVECERITKSLTTEIREIQARVDRGEIAVPIHARAVTVPSIIRLRERVEDYLYRAKSALRDFSGIFPVLFGKDAPVGNFAKVAKWAGEKFGSNHMLAQGIAADNDGWIRRLVGMRDAVEHPTSKLGPLTINDFKFDYSQPDKILVCEPCWHLRGEDPVPIAESLASVDHNLLTFCEETLMAALQSLPTQAFVNFAEIPEAQRNPACPIRFIACLPPGFASKFQQVSGNAQPAT